MADERSGPNRGWIRNHLMQCTPACSHHRHHHHCQRVPDLENDRVGATLGLQRMHIIGNPSWVPLPITEITFFLLQVLSHLHLRTTRTFPWQDSSTASFAFVCLLVCLLPGSGLSTSPFLWLNPCGSTQYARPGPTPPIAQPHPPLTVLFWACCVVLLWISSTDVASLIGA